MATASLDQPASGSPAAAARIVALALPSALLGGALLSQYVGGLHPCEMCYWQRWPHGAAIALAALTFLFPAGNRNATLLTILAATAVAISGAIGVFHAGVEYGWWEGLTTCTASGGLSLDELMNVPLVRCDEVQWSLAGISMAGFNAIFSLGGAALILALLKRARA
ncbi:disulfide bond formation protein B [Sphingomonas sp. HDW15A]|uniref:disulfide bond formation protein B n=1 Tax=Sphingomonas sp. HDW15A TaxID=2714942 RepID=UPI00140CBFBD|nr:disulfide bond formation protein B [Sphingomonas sp. HDW15A]QIK96687.1 disulfide bond formation protein B [Sphingomonas sp. HDW15A]